MFSRLNFCDLSRPPVIVTEKVTHRQIGSEDPTDLMLSPLRGLRHSPLHVGSAPPVEPHHGPRMAAKNTREKFTRESFSAWGTSGEHKGGVKFELQTVLTNSNTVLMGLKMASPLSLRVNRLFNLINLRKEIIGSGKPGVTWVNTG